MKYAIIIPDGCADEPQAALGREDAAAGGPHAGDGRDRRARASWAGRDNVPDHLPAGSDVANLSLLGYDPTANFTGRAPLEAAAQGIELGPDDWAIRCNLVTVEDQIMRDFTAGHISTGEAAAVAAGRCSESWAAGRGSSMPASATATCWSIAAAARRRRSPRDTRTTPPHDLTDKIGGRFPRGPGSDLLNDLMSRSVDAVCRASGQCRAPAGGQAAGHERLAVGAGQDAQPAAVSARCTASGAR